MVDGRSVRTNFVQDIEHERRFVLPQALTRAKYSKRVIARDTEAYRRGFDADTLKCAMANEPR